VPVKVKCCYRIVQPTLGTAKKVRHRDDVRIALRIGDANICVHSG